MGFKQDNIDGVHVVQLVKNVDWRGYLIETFRIDMLPEEIQPQMSYVSYTEAGLVRGPHEHMEQTDMFAFIGPGNFKVKLWDNRKQSKTFRHVMTYFSGLDNPLLIVVPPGVVHGYKNISLTERGMVIVLQNKLLKSLKKNEEVDEIRHDDQSDEFYRDFISEN